MQTILQWAATIVGATCVLVSILLMLGLPTSSLAEFPNPLAPPDTQNPRATLNSFRTELETAERLMVAAYKQQIAEGGVFTSKSVHDQEDAIRLHLDRAIRTLDLTDVPPANRQQTATETVMLLEEVLDRVGLPNPGAIPDTDAMKTLHEKGERLAWTVPNSEIRIVRIDSGARAGEYLFSTDTVARAYEFYQKVRSIPPSDNFDFYAFYALSPGDLVPPKWYALIQKLPPWFQKVDGNSARWQWIALGLTICVALGFCLIVFKTTREDGAMTQRSPDWLPSLALPLAVLLAIWAVQSVIAELNIVGPPQRVLAAVFDVIFYLPFTWLAIVASNRLADTVTDRWGARRYAFDAGIVRAAIRIAGVFAAAGLLAYGASQLGVPLVGIIAGLGVGGLAVALAAQPTIENFIGGIMIYADRPVRVGDQCQFGDVTGVVEEIGIRSTRIRSADRSVTTIPNADFSKARIVNYSRRDSLPFKATLGLRYGTTEKQLRDVMRNIRKLLASNASVDAEKAAVHFSGFARQSLIVDVSAELKSTAVKDIANVREDLLLRLFKIIEKSGTGLTAH